MSWLIAKKVEPVPPRLVGRLGGAGWSGHEEAKKEKERLSGVGVVYRVGPSGQGGVCRG